MTVRTRDIRSIHLIELSGRFFGDTETDELEHAIMDAARQGTKYLVLEMSACEVLNSTALGVIMRGVANFRGRGGDVRLAGLGKRLKDLFVMTKLIMVIDAHETREEAIAAFAAP